MASDFASSLRATLIDFLAPLREAAADPAAMATWLATLGYTTAVSNDPALHQIAASAESIAQSLNALDGAALDGWTGVTAVLQAGHSISALVAQLRAFAQDPSRASFAGTLADEMFAAMLASYLRRRRSLLFRLGGALQVVEQKEIGAADPAIVQDGVTMRRTRVLDRFNFSVLSQLLANPAAVLSAAYLPNGMVTGLDAWNAGQKLFPILSSIADEIGVGWNTAQDLVGAATAVSMDTTMPLEAPPRDFDVMLSDASGDPVPTIDPKFYADFAPKFNVQLAQSGTNALTLALQSSSAQHPNAVPGFVLNLIGALGNSVDVGAWRIAFSSQGQIPAFSLSTKGVALMSGGTTSPGGTATVSVKSIPPADRPNGPSFVFGDPSGTRLEIGFVDAGATLSFDPSRQAIGVSFGATKSAFVLASGDSDGFVGSLIPSGGLRGTFDIGLTWSSDKGLSIRGSAGLDALIPIGFSAFGVSLPSIQLGLSTTGSSLRASAGANVTASIGPVEVSISGVGVAATLNFPGGGGNLGPADLDFSLQGPSGVGLSLDTAGVVTGSGFLFHDAAHSTYVGALQVTIHDTLTLTALGLIATTLPDGSRGYSLLVFITAQDFKPIPLGLGFTLQAIGGLVAINRTFDEQVIRDGLKNDTLKSLLFPQDPVTNAPAIVRTLETAFPARRGSYLLGLLARIGWGTPTLLQFDLALILELGARERLIALGRVTATLPTPSNALLHITLDALGVLDFDAGTVALDAQLVDSRLAGVFAITGGAALRAGWGGSGPGKAFLLSVGGFNPRFVPPAGVPTLPRVAIALSAGSNPRLTCEAYFALTSNTVQFGARAQLVASAGGFSLVGDIGFDVLFDSPVHFIADFQASVQLKAGSTNLFTVAVSGTLEGLLPLRFSGKARFEILWCHITVSVRATLRDGTAPAVATVDAVPLLVAALANVGNWSTQRAAGTSQGVALRSVLANGTSVANTPATPASSGSSAVLVLDPLGTLAVTQSVVPLATGRDVDKVQGAPVSGAKRFTLTGTLGGSVTPAPSAPTAVTALPGDFAPAQYFAMTDDEQVASPSFESWQAGVTLGSAAATVVESQLVSAPLTYDAYVMDAFAAAAPVVLPAPTSYVLPAGQVAAHAATGAAARAPTRRVGRARFRVTAPPQVSLTAPTYAVVATATGTPVVTAPSVQTWSEHQAVADVLNRTGQSYALVAVA